MNDYQATEPVYKRPRPYSFDICPEPKSENIVVAEPVSFTMAHLLGGTSLSYLTHNTESSQRDDSNCFHCGESLQGEMNVFINGRMIHQSCFDHTPPPKEEEVQEENPTPSIIEDSSPRLGIQPARYQIANYNIHPPPSIFIEKPFAENQTVYAQLVDCHTMTVVGGGFQSGDSRFLRAGQKTLYFTGLKLSKMAPIKTELHLRTSKQMNSNFCLKFKVADRVLLSDQFKLVSSCSQLPPDIRELVRPKKPSKKDESDDEDATGSPPPTPTNLGWRDVSNWEDMKHLRLELETAIEAGDAEKAARAASRLATLKKTQRSR